MTIEEITLLVEQAIDAALALAWSDEYENWACAWLNGSNRSIASAQKAKNHVNQWLDFGGESDAGLCLYRAAQAAIELAKTEWEGYRIHSARQQAEKSIDHARTAHLPQDRWRRNPRPQDELVIDDNGMRTRAHRPAPKPLPTQPSKD